MQASALTVVLLTVASASGAPSAPGAHRQDGVKELLDQVLAEPDRVDTDVIEALAAHGTEASLDALKRAARALEEWSRVHAVYAGAVVYQNDLEAEAIAWVVDAVQKPRDDTHMLAAARSLAAFGDRAHEQQERVFARHRDQRVKDIVFQPLVPYRGREASTKAVEDILDHGDLREPEHRRAVLEALSGCVDPKVDKLLIKRLGARDSSLVLREALVTLLAARPGKAVDKALVSAASADGWEVQVRALEALASRGDPSAANKVKKLIEQDYTPVVREAVVTLDVLAEDREAWNKQAIRLARSDERGVRMGAAVALARAGGQDEVQALERLFADPFWTVRAEAYQAARRRGAAASLPALEARREVEHGRLAADLHRIIAELSGVPGPAGSALPTFFGIPIESRHVVFLVDRSSSMGNKLKSSPWAGKTRLQACAQELADLLDQVPPEVTLGLAFFDSEVRSLSLGRAVDRAEIVSYVRRMQPGRGGADLYGALLEGLATGADTLFVVADGDPTLGAVIAPDLLVERIEMRHRSNKVRIHTVALGKQRALLEGLAAATGGTYENLP